MGGISNRATVEIQNKVPHIYTREGTHKHLVMLSVGTADGWYYYQLVLLSFGIADSWYCYQFVLLSVVTANS